MEPININGRTVQPQPLEFDHRADVAIAHGDLVEQGAGLADRQHLFYAALGLGLPDSLQPTPAYDDNPNGLRAYGRRVYRLLRGRGVPHGVVFGAAVSAFLTAAGDIFPTVEEAKDRADFSGAGGGPANLSPSTSPFSTAIIPDGSTDSPAESR